MNYNDLNPNVVDVLSNANWCKERNLKAYLQFTREKKIFPKFLEIAESFVGINFNYLNVNDINNALYFDLDESVVSKNMRARYYNYDSHLDSDWLIDPDYRETEDFYVTKNVISKIGKTCARIAFWDDGEIGFDLYVDSDGKIYACNYDDPSFINNNIIDFLNQEIKNNIVQSMGSE